MFEGQGFLGRTGSEMGPGVGKWGILPRKLIKPGKIRKNGTFPHRKLGFPTQQITIELCGCTRRKVQKGCDTPDLPVQIPSDLIPMRPTCWFPHDGLPPVIIHFERWDSPVHKNHPVIFRGTPIEKPQIPRGSGAPLETRISRTTSENR